MTVYERKSQQKYQKYQDVYLFIKSVKCIITRKASYDFFKFLKYLVYTTD